MLTSPAPHARNAPAPAPTRFRGWDSDPSRPFLMLAHTNHILQPTPCRAHTTKRILAGVA
jgi:hypothetical protein